MADSSHSKCRLTRQHKRPETRHSNKTLSKPINLHFKPIEPTMPPVKTTDTFLGVGMNVETDQGNEHLKRLVA